MLKSEKGSITVFVLVVMLFFTIILMGVLVSANNSRKSQKTAETTIIDNYQKDVDMVDVIYNEKLNEYDKLNYSDIAEVKWNRNEINQLNLTASATINFYESDLSKINNFKYIINTSRNLIGRNSSDWNSAQTVNNNISSEGTLTNLPIQNNSVNFIHVLINYTSGKKIEIVSDALKINIE